MLSVLIVSPSPVVPGGVSVFAECLKRHLKETRYRSFFVGSPGKKSQPMPIAFARVLLSPLSLLWELHRHPAEVIHLNPTFDAKSLTRDILLLLALRLGGHRHILFYVHGWDTHFSTWIQNQATLRKLVVWGLNKASKVSVLSNSFRDSLVELGVRADKLIVTKTMFDGDGLELARSLPPATARPFILFMSRFDREKGGRELLDAFRVIGKEFADIDLVMAGDGGDTKTLLARTALSPFKRRIHFTGYISGGQKWRYLRDCTIFALPTYYRSEGMPIVVLEAMAQGKPLLIGPAGALPTVLAGQGSGIILEKVSASSIADGLRHLLSEASALERAGQINRSLAYHYFDAKVVTKEIEGFYLQVAKC